MLACMGSQSISLGRCTVHGASRMSGSGLTGASVLPVHAYDPHQGGQKRAIYATTYSHMPESAFFTLDEPRRGVMDLDQQQEEQLHGTIQELWAHCGISSLGSGDGPCACNTTGRPGGLSYRVPHCPADEGGGVDQP